jgi:hypothetical protein
MKKTLLLSLPIFLFASQSNIDLKILELENEIKTLKQEVKFHQEDLDERIPIIEMVEKKSILDKVNFSPELLLRFDKFDYVNKSIEGETTMIYGNPDYIDGTYNRRTDYTKNFDIASSMRFRLNMDMDLGDIKFHGRMLYMNSSQSNQRVCILSRDIKTGEPGSAFDVDRAYINYTPNKASDYAFTFSFGLLPTSGGTPVQYAQDRQRGSMFPSLVFDMNTYGMIGTQKLGEDTFVRLILAKPYTLRAQFYPYQCNRENIDNANIVGAYSDTKFHFLGNSLFSFGVNILHDLKAHPYLGPDIGSNDSHNLGTMVTFGIGVDIEKVADTDTTLFFHTALSNPHGNGNIDDYQIKIPTDVNDSGFTTSNYATGTMLTSNGYSIYLGTKYDINENFNLGAEYNYGSKYWFSSTQGAEDMFNKLATRGSAYEIYSTWKYHKYLNAKLAYLNIHEAYTGSGWHFGPPAKKDATQSIISLSLEAKF